MEIQLQDRTLGQWMEHWAETTPDKEYLVYSDRDLRFTWKEFNERVDRMAKGMLSIGIKHGTHVGIWATNVPDWLTFLYAAAKIGAVAVTVNTNYKQSELEFLVENADIHTMCITDGVFDGSYVDMMYTMLPELKESQRGYLEKQTFPGAEERSLYRAGEIQRDVQHPRTAAFRRKRKRRDVGGSQEAGKPARRREYAIYFRHDRLPQRGHADAL